MIQFSRLGAMVGAAWIATAGCGDGSPSARVALTQAERSIERFRLAFDLEIGSVDGVDDSFSRVEAVLPRADGSVFVLDPDTGGALEFDPDGRLIRQLGRLGSGPGEFQFPLHMGWWGGDGSVWITDPIASRLSVFSPSGEMSRSSSVSMGGRRTDLATGAEFITCRVMLDTTVVAVSEVTPWGVPQSPVTVARASSGDGDTVGILKLERSEFSIPIPILTPGGGGVMKDPLPDGPMLRFSPRNGLVFAVTRDDPKSGEDAEVSVRAVDLDGATMWTASLTVRPVPVPRQVRDSILHYWKEELRDYPSFRELSRLRADAAIEEMLDLPAYYPPIQAAVPTGEGGLWLVWNGSGPETEASMLDRGGTRMGILTISRKLAGNLAAVEGDYAWTITKGQFDVPLVRRYRIVME
jgi:hypothetical protein